MIYDNISNAHLYFGISPELDYVLKDIQQKLYLPATQPELIKNFITFETGLEAEKFYEKHFRYYDVHVVLSGHEHYKMVPFENLTDLTEYNPEHDILFGTCDTYLTKGVMTPNHFIVFFPHEAHKVGYTPHAHESISKIVYKVKV